MTIWSPVLGSLVLALCLVRSASAAEALRPAQLRTEWLTNPLGLDAEKPRLSWRVESEGRGQRQTAYRLLVASSLEKLQKDEGDLWDSEKVESDETLGIGYAGKALFSGQEVFWKVKVWDKEAKESAWSETAMWSMGLLKPEDWQAQWISFKDDSPVHADRETLHLPPARLYGNDFAASKPVRRAMLYASALGLAEFHLNGQKIGDAYFEPGWSDYRERAWYRAHDVTDLVRPGANRLGAVVADGWYAGYVGYGLLVGYGPNQAGRNFYGRTPALLAQLEIEYADGSREIVGTDASWQVTSDGPYREADLIMGETFDARRTDSVQWKWEPAILAEQNGSVKAAFRDALGTREVELGFQKPKRLQAYSGPAIRVTEELKPHRLTEPAPGVYIFDLGQNLAGNVRLEVKGPAGTKIQLRYGEMLHPDGRLMTENLRKARATDTYLLRGDPEGEVWTPRFTYHGFQYVEVTGLPAKPALGAITGLVIQSDTPMVSSFACSDEVLTKFWQNTRWTQRANFIELPTDCPQRDERLGWMGDAQIYVRTATFNADVAAFFTKWLDDLEEAQRDSGAYPDYAPYPMAHGKPGATHGTAWTDAGVICPWTIWKVYGDTRVIERHWNSMRRFMDWRRTADPNLQGVELGNTWGDWLNVNEDTPIEFIDLCYHAYSCRLMAEMAEAIGRNAEAESYRIRFEEIQKHFVTRYARPDGDLGVDTQTAYVLGLWVGLLPEQWAPKAAARLAEKIEKNGFRMATGFLGTKALLPVLTANGHHDLAVRLFQSRQFPSWGYEVVQGATTVWERWDSFTKEHGFDGATGKNNAAMNSFSHYAFGAVAEWMFRDLAGIDTEGAGYRRIVLKPGPPAAPAPDVPALDWAKAETTQARGRIASAWTMDAGRLAFNVTIPANTTAIVSIPAKSREGVTESEHPLDAAEGVKFLRMEGDRAICEIESGSYQFRSAWP